MFDAAKFFTKIGMNFSSEFKEFRGFNRQCIVETKFK